MVSFKLEPGRPLTEIERNALEKAKSLPIVYDEDCPELTPQMEKAFIAARKAKPYNAEAVTLYLTPETIAKARKIDTDYVAILGRILDKAVAEYSFA